MNEKMKTSISYEEFLLRFYPEHYREYMLEKLTGRMKIMMAEARKSHRSDKFNRTSMSLIEWS